MKIRQTLALALATLAAAGAAQAEERTVTTTATIMPTCVFREVPTELAFPSIDPSGNEPVTADATVKFSCTRDSTVRFGVNGQETGNASATLTRNGGTDTLAYSVSWQAATNLSSTGLARGHSAANWASVKVTGSIPAIAYQDAAAGSYTDGTGLKLSINP